MSNGQQPERQRLRIEEILASEQKIADIIEMQQKPKAWDHVRANRLLVFVALGLVALGAVVGRLLPPFVIDQTFLRDFLISPGCAGVLALAAALIALLPALRKLEDERTHAKNVEWREFIMWAIDLARSESDRDVMLGLHVCQHIVQKGLDDREKNADAIIIALATSMLDCEDRVGRENMVSQNIQEDGDSESSDNSDDSESSDNEVS